MKKVMLVFGTRPEAIKMCPLCLELSNRAGIECRVLVTGQHRGMLDCVLEIFDVVPDIDLNVMHPGQSIESLSIGVLDGVCGAIDAERPDMMLVHGDTTSAAMAALAALYRSVPIGHVEAGLRTGNVGSPFPEEFNRRMIDMIASLYFAPTPVAVGNLISEGVTPESIYLSGNTVTDALRITKCRRRLPEVFANETRRLIFITLHRRESWGEVMRELFGMARRIAEEREDVVVVCPLHPSHEVRCAAGCLYGVERLIVTEPLDMLSCHAVMEKAYLILTDSGGIQEEATVLGTPTLVLRDTTERIEGVSAGGLRLVGREPGSIFREVCRLLDDTAEYEKMKSAKNPYGNGHASEKIADAIEKYFGV